MINIHEKLWIVKGYNRTVEDSESLLAYMTYADYTKDNSESKAFLKRMDTGKNWAEPRKTYNYEKREYDPLPNDFKVEDNIFICDNFPLGGFKIIGSVSRWSTDNKVIQIEDPRGFVVEIPTSNLTTLLKHTVVDHGIVCEKCVWGREANNHILLPINSDVYRRATEQTKSNNEKVSFAKLEAGDVVKFSVDDNVDYIYLGRAKAVWSVTIKESTNTYNYFSSRSPEAVTKDMSTIEVTDSKWCHVFKCKTKRRWKSEYCYEYKLSGKVIVVGKEDSFNRPKSFKVHIPDRVVPEDKNGCKYNTSCWRGYGNWIEATTKEFIWK